MKFYEDKKKKILKEKKKKYLQIKNKNNRLKFYLDKDDNNGENFLFR